MDKIILGIESTAHTFGIAVTQGKKVLCNLRDSYTTEEGGMIPFKVAEHHLKIFIELFSKALKKANISSKDIDAIAYSQSPGLGPALRIGATFARSLHLLLKKPLVGVNHCIAHLEVGRVLIDAEDPILVYASGANTQIIAYDEHKYRIFGETLDIGIGNFLDSFGRYAGLGFPAGPKIDKLAKGSKNYIELPYNVKGMDLVFGGILTNLRQKLQSKEYELKDLCYSAQETVFAMLMEVTERAIAHTGKKEILLGGGVACNSRLQEMVKILAAERGIKCYILENQYNLDNAAMIALTGGLMLNAGVSTAMVDSIVKPYERTDEVVVSWREV
jgi:N6-L-threonylcarbamoyladenine synthase